MRFLCILLILASSCTSSKKTEKVDPNSLEGKWKFTSHQLITSEKKENETADSNHSLISQIGLSRLKEVDGKTIQFRHNGRVIVDFIDKEYKSYVQIWYEDKKKENIIEFRANHDFGEIFDSVPVRYTLKGNKMTWMIDNMLELNLVRVKKG